MIRITFILISCLILVQLCRPRNDGQALMENPETWINSQDCMTFVRIRPGFLHLNETVPQGDSMVNRLKKVTIDSGFWMGATEVTVSQFMRFVEETGYVTAAEKQENRHHWKNPGFLQAGDHPVVYLSQEDALAYTDWAGVELPTETEWLYACAAGTEGRYFWGDTLDDRYLWHRRNSPGGTRPAAQKLSNPWGLYDMVGNACEYVNVCDKGYAVRGASWTRCDFYKTRQGFFAEHLIASSVEKKLTQCMPFNGTPWDDDRGFRCIKR